MVTERFLKYMTNYGYINLQSDVADAFAHFSWCTTNGKELVVDIQGWGGNIYTDPVIHTKEVSLDDVGKRELFSSPEVLMHSRLW